MTSSRLRVVLSFAVVLLAIATSPVLAGSHTWDVWEVFSNADGTVQFIELHENNGTSGETGLAGHNIVVNPTGNVYTLLNNVASPTTNKFYLLATSDFALLAGAPTPDEIIPDNFIDALVDNQVQYIPWDNGNWTAGTLPTDGITSLNRVGASLVPGAVNSPTNYAGVTGSVDASGAVLPGVPDGSGGSTPMTVAKLAADGSSLSVSWDTSTCTDGNDHQIIFGQRSDFPVPPGGVYTLLGAECGIGSTSPFNWNPTPNSADGSGLIWFLIVAVDGATEGPWGKHDGVDERLGPGTNGSSDECGVSDKDLSETCGH